VGNRRPVGQVLIFDADDTLWENNILFERVIEDYLTWLDHPTLDRHEVRAVLNDIQAANAITHGYGAKMLLRSLDDCFQRLSERPATAAEREAIEELVAALTDHEVELMPGVAETLVQLGERHSLLLLTKGDPDDQRRKLDASRLGHHFAHVHIVAEKHVGTYEELIERHGLAVEETWMIGNSPKSDIIASRAAGLRAVFVPHPNTWAHENADLDPRDNGILRVATFGELVRHF
jgi:putative hydrolase of the HAD superfamily